MYKLLNNVIRFAKMNRSAFFSNIMVEIEDVIERKRAVKKHINKQIMIMLILIVQLDTSQKNAIFVMNNLLEIKIQGIGDANQKL